MKCNGLLTALIGLTLVGCGQDNQSALVKAASQGDADAQYLVGHTLYFGTGIPRNYEEELTRNCELSNIPIIRFDKSGKELGAVCGRPHKVSMIGIINAGNSKILDYID